MRRQMIKRGFLSLTLVVLLAIAGTEQGGAASIAVVVNDAPITSHDIAQRIRLLKLSSGGRGVSKEKAVDDLIEEKLKLHAAKQLGLRINESEVARAYETIAERTKMSPKRFTQALNSMGVESDSLKARLRADLAWRDVIQKKFARAIAVRDQDIVDAVREKSKERKEKQSQLVTEYRLARVMAIIPQKGGSQAKARATANTLSQKLNGCDNLEEQIKGFKDTVKLIPVSRKETELSKETAAALAKTPIGRAGPPSLTEIGYEVPIVCEKNQVAREQIGGHGLQEDLVRGEIDNFADRYLKELKGKAIIVRK